MAVPRGDVNSRLLAFGPVRFSPGSLLALQARTEGFVSSDDGKLLGASVVGSGFGIYLFFKGFREFREYRVVADTPVIPIRSVPMGLVQIRGQAKGDAPVTSPVSHTPCFWYRVVIEQWKSRAGRSGEEHY